MRLILAYDVQSSVFINELPFINFLGSLDEFTTIMSCRQRGRVG